MLVGLRRVCQRPGPVKLRHVAVDGTRAKASASNHPAMHDEGMVKEEQGPREENAWRRNPFSPPIPVSGENGQVVSTSLAPQ